MPVKVEITDGGLGFIMKGEGIVTGEEILRGIAERFSSAEQTKKYLYGMSDYTKVEHVKISSEEIKQIAEMDESSAKINPNLIIAIAAPQDIMFGLSRMFSVYASNTGWDIEVFRTLQEAEKSTTYKLENKHSKGIKINFR